MEIGVEVGLCLAEMCFMPPFFGAVCLSHNKDEKEDEMNAKKTNDESKVYMPLPTLELKTYVLTASKITECYFGNCSPIISYIIDYFVVSPASPLSSIHSTLV